MYGVIKLLKAVRVGVGGRGVAVDFAVPEHVVGNDEAASAHFVDNQIVIFGIFALVGVDENQIETAAQRGNNLPRVAKVILFLLFFAFAVFFA